MSRRVVVAFAVPLGGYAVLLVIALLGGPRIGAPVIPLPGGGGVEAAQPVTGPPMPGEAGETLPPIPPEPTPKPSSPPLSTGPRDENGQPGQPATTSAPGEGRPSASVPVEPPTVEPTPGIAERRNPSMPPATKTPPAPSPTDPTDPGEPPSTPGTPSTPPTATPTPTVTPTGPPDQPKPPTLADTLLILLGKLRR